MPCKKPFGSGAVVNFVQILLRCVKTLGRLLLLGHLDLHTTHLHATHGHARSATCRFRRPGDVVDGPYGSAWSRAPSLLSSPTPASGGGCFVLREGYSGGPQAWLRCRGSRPLCVIPALLTSNGRAATGRVSHHISPQAVCCPSLTSVWELVWVTCSSHPLCWRPSARRVFYNRLQYFFVPEA